MDESSQFAGLQRAAVELAFPGWLWTVSDSARISLYWPDEDVFTIDVDLYQAGVLVRHRTYTGAEAVQFGMAMMERAAE